MIALPAILLFKRRRREGDDAEPLEHRLRMVDWHMQKEIDRQIQLYKKELHQQKKKKRAGFICRGRTIRIFQEEARLSHGTPVAKKNPKDKHQPAGKKDPEARAKP